MGNLGWTEILIILVIALIVFGPRKLPELGKSLGQSLAQFRRASEDFKRTWEEEVEVEKQRLEAPAPTPDPTVEYNSDPVYGATDSASIAAQEDSAVESAEATGSEVASAEVTSAKVEGEQEPATVQGEAR